MEEIMASPIVVPLLFLLRCVLPIAVMLAISSLLRKGGWIVGSKNHMEEDSKGNLASGGNTHV
jgi:hypothetical protein